MRNINKIAYSVANEIAPDLKKRKNFNGRGYFALVLNHGSSLTIGDVREIAERLALTPVFIAFNMEREFDKSRYFSRLFNSKILLPKTKNEFYNAISECEFTVSENITGAFFSLLSHKPSYLNAKCGVCRTFIAELMSMGCDENIIIPYTKNRIEIIKKVRARDSDFSYIINKIQNRISYEIIEALRT